MTRYPVTEVYLFLTLFLAGAVTAAYYQLTTSCGRVFSHRVFTTLFDIVFVAGAVTMLYFTLQIAADGNVRVYQIAGFIIGFCFFNLVYSQIIVKLLKKTANVFGRLSKRLSAAPIIKYLLK